jgi:hypothetical protein
MFSGKPWTPDEIEMLDMLLRNGVYARQACKVLQRSRLATEHATKNIIYQQLLTHTPYEIAERYNTEVEWITEGIVSPKYNINHETDECESESESECECESDNEHEREEEVESKQGNSLSNMVTATVLIGTTSALCSLVLLGVGYYAHILCLNWTNM